MSDLNFVDNTAGAYGGGVYVDGILAVSDAEFYSNTAQGRGGGAYVVGKLTLTDTKFLNNTAGVYVSDTGNTGWNSRLTNGVFVNNTGAVGGVWIDGGTVDVFNTTITQDPDRYGGSGIYVGQGTAHVINTIIASHTTGIVQSGSSAVYEDYNLFFNTAITYTGLITHGTYSSFTSAPAFAADGYHLTAGSAAINKGSNINVRTDIDGESRPDGCALDIGADEFMAGRDCKHIYLPLLRKNRP
jgi:hypothetical protein